MVSSRVGYYFVILPLVVPGGSEYGLGLIAYLKRMCVPTFDDRNMSNVPYPSAGSKAWGTLIVEHIANSAIPKEYVSGMVGASMKELHIPDVLYEDVRVQRRAGSLVLELSIPDLQNSS